MRCHHPVGRTRPQEPAPFQPLRAQARALAVMPDHLQKIAASATKAKQMSAQRIAPQHLLNLQCQRRKSLPHVGVTRGQPHAHAARNRNLERPRTAKTRASAVASIPLSTTTRCPHLSTISIRLVTAVADTAGAALGCSGEETEPPNELASATTAGANLTVWEGSPRRPSRASRRQVNNWLADKPFRRAVADTGPL